MVFIKKIIFVIIAALVIFIVTSAFFYTAYGQHLEFKAYDYLQQKSLKNKTQSDQIVIVAIDDETFQSFDIQWPFPRTYHIKLIENLKKLGAKQIIFDIEFSESHNQEVDLNLGKVAKDHSNVVFAGKIYQSRENDYVLTTVLPPVKEIRASNVPWGIVNMATDLDGFVRKYPIFHNVNNKTFYSLALQSYLLNQYPDITETNKQIGISKIIMEHLPLVSSNELLINYYGPPKNFKYISYSSVVDDSSFKMPIEDFFEINDFYFLKETEVFKDKIVFVGASVDELKDNFSTPVNPKNQLMPGVEIHANMMQMLLDHNYLFKIPNSIINVFYILLLIILSYVFYTLKPHISIIYAFVSIVIYIVSVYLVFYHINWVLPILIFPLTTIILYVSYLIYHYLLENKEKKNIKKTFQHYMAPTLVKELLKSPDKLKYGGTLTEISVLFSDIRSFTTYTESHAVEDTVSMLREYLTEMVNIIIANQGILDKFVGDEVMALFNTPVPVENHALKACICAVQMIDKLRELQKKWISEGKEAIDIGVGVNTGMALVGNLGSEQIFDYTAIGDTVNLGARLEALNKNYKTTNNIIISEFTLEHVKDYIEFEYLDEVVVKGKTKAIKIYQLISLKENIK